MITLGLTGSIGAGKTTISNKLREMGVPVFDSDEAVHALYSEGGEGVPLIERNFPEALDGGCVDRKKLSHILLSNPQLFSQLETLIHPLVKKAQEHFLAIRKTMNQDIVTLSIPLLFETQAHKNLDYTLLLTASDKVLEERTLARPNMTIAKFKTLRARQMSEEKKCALANFVLDTEQTEEKTYQELEAILKKLQTIVRKG